MTEPDRRRPARPSGRSSTTRCPTTRGHELVPPGHARRRPAARHGVRRRRDAGPRRAAGDLAGRPDGTVPQVGARSAATARVHRLGPRGDRPDRPLLRSPPSSPGRATAGAAPFFAVTVFARGLLNRLFTRAYLPGDDAAPVR